MARPPNSSASEKCQATISKQSDELLDSLARLGVYGRSKGEVAGRFIEQVLQTLIERPRLDVPPEKASTAALPPLQPRLGSHPRRRKRRGRA